MLLLQYVLRVNVIKYKNKYSILSNAFSDTLGNFKCGYLVHRCAVSMRVEDSKGKGA